MQRFSLLCTFGNIHRKMFFLSIFSIQCKIRHVWTTDTRRSTGRSRSTQRWDRNQSRLWQDSAFFFWTRSQKFG